MQKTVTAVRKKDGVKMFSSFTGAVRVFSVLFLHPFMHLLKLTI